MYDQEGNNEGAIEALEDLQREEIRLDREQEADMEKSYES